MWGVWLWLSVSGCLVAEDLCLRSPKADEECVLVAECAILRLWIGRIGQFGIELPFRFYWNINMLFLMKRADGHYIDGFVRYSVVGALQTVYGGTNFTQLWKRRSTCFLIFCLPRWYFCERFRIAAGYWVYLFGEFPWFVIYWANRWYASVTRGWQGYIEIQIPRIGDDGVVWGGRDGVIRGRTVVCTKSIVKVICSAGVRLGI